MKHISLYLLATMLAMPAFAEIKVIAPITGTLAVPGTNIEIRTRSSADAVDVFVLGECLSKHGGMASRIGDGSWVWRGTIINSFKPNRICKVISISHVSTGGTEDSKPIYLVPKRGEVFNHLRSDAPDVLPCKAEAFHVYASIGLWGSVNDVTFDRNLKVEPEDATMVSYLGFGKLYGKRVGSTKLVLTYAQSDGSTLTARVPIEVLKNDYFCRNPDTVDK